MICTIRMRNNILNRDILLLKFFPKVKIVAKRIDIPTAETVKYRCVEVKTDSGDLSQAKRNDNINHANEKNKVVIIFWSFLNLMINNVQINTATLPVKMYKSELFNVGIKIFPMVFNGFKKRFPLPS